MYVNLPKKFITRHLLIHLVSNESRRKTKVPLWRVVNGIIYRLKTGCQWRELPMKQFCRETLITWQTVYYYFNKWSKSGRWKVVWHRLLAKNRTLLDLSSIALDGSHTPCKNGGQAVGYQTRKKAKTTNALFLTDNKGLPLAMSTPVAGRHHDLFQIENVFQNMLADLRAAGLNYQGLFLNADAGFDSKGFRNRCFANDIIANIDFNKRNSKTTDCEYFFDEILYKKRFVVERMNAWIDAFKVLLVRFETSALNWTSLHYLAFSLILISKNS